MPETLSSGLCDVTVLVGSEKRPKDTFFGQDAREERGTTETDGESNSPRPASAGLINSGPGSIHPIA